jgi:hypothetical protein
MKPSKRLFRFTLLLAITVLGVGLGLKVSRAHRQRAAAASIHDYGGAVYDDSFDRIPHPPRTPNEPEWLVEIVGRDFFQSVDAVALAMPPASPTVEVEGKRAAAYAHFENLPDLQHALLSGDDANDAALSHIAHCKRLSMLTILCGQSRSNRGVTARGLKQLRGHPRLERLFIANASLDDDALEALAEIPNLRELSIFGRKCVFTDEGRQRLARLRSLRKLELPGLP